MNWVEEKGLKKNTIELPQMYVCARRLQMKWIDNKSNNLNVWHWFLKNRFLYLLYFSCLAGHILAVGRFSPKLQQSPASAHQVHANGQSGSGCRMIHVQRRRRGEGRRRHWPVTDDDGCGRGEPQPQQEEAFSMPGRAVNELGNVIMNPAVMFLYRPNKENIQILRIWTKYGYRHIYIYILLYKFDKEPQLMANRYGELKLLCKWPTWTKMYFYNNNQFVSNTKLTGNYPEPTHYQTMNTHID